MPYLSKAISRAMHAAGQHHGCPASSKALCGADGTLTFTQRRDRHGGFAPARVTILLTCLIIVCSAIVAHEEPGMKLKTDALAGFIFCHLLALLAFVPWFFSWTGVVLLIVGMYVFGV